MAQFSHRDVSDALALVHAAAIRDAPSAPFSPPVLDGLARLVPGSTVGYHEREIDSHRLVRQGGTHGAAQPRDPSPHDLSDFVSRRQLHRLDYYQHAPRPMGVEHQIRLWLPAPRGLARYLFVNRCRVDGDFAERDQEILELLRLFLAASAERCEHPGFAGVDGLTQPGGRDPRLGRRWQDGQADRLPARVSPHTVRKHLEHSYEKLGAHTRTEAIARAFESGSGSARAG